MENLAGLSESITLAKFLFETFFRAMGWSANNLEKGIGKIADIRRERMKLALSLKEREEFIAGGEATMEEIFKTKGELPDRCYHLKISSWESDEAQQFLKDCEAVNVKVVPLKDLDPSDDEIQFIMHSSDVGRLEPVLEKMTTGKISDIAKAETTEEYYNSLSDKDLRDKEISDKLKKIEEEHPLSIEDQKIFQAEINKVLAERKKVKSVISSVPTTSIDDKNEVVSDYARIIKFNSGIAILDKQDVSMGDDITQLRIDKDESYPFKGVDGKPRVILGKELLEKIEEEYKDKVNEIQNLIEDTQEFKEEIKEVKEYIR